MSYTLDDFRTAAAADGVNVIPFPDLRRDATSIADEVDRRKDEAEFNSVTFEKQKDNLLEEIKKKNGEIEGTRKQLEDFKRDNPGATVPSFYEEDIKKREDDIKESNDKISDLNNQMTKAAEAFDRLYNARAGLREYFDKVKDQLKDVRSNPTSYLGGSPSDDDLKQLETYLGVIENEIEVEEGEHKIQEDGAKNTRDELQKVINKTEV
jgi:chromosome segregation ATPase